MGNSNSKDKDIDEENELAELEAELGLELDEQNELKQEKSVFHPWTEIGFIICGRNGVKIAPKDYPYPVPNVKSVAPSPWGGYPEPKLAKMEKAFAELEKAHNEIKEKLEKALSELKTVTECRDAKLKEIEVLNAKVKELSDKIASYEKEVAEKSNEIKKLSEPKVQTQLSTSTDSEPLKLSFAEAIVYTHKRGWIQ